MQRHFITSGKGHLSIIIELDSTCIHDLKKITVNTVDININKVNIYIRHCNKLETSKSIPVIVSWLSQANGMNCQELQIKLI